MVLPGNTFQRTGACCVSGVRFVEPPRANCPRCWQSMAGSMPSTPTREAAGHGGLNRWNRWFTSGPSRPGANPRRSTAPLPSRFAKLATSTPQASLRSASSRSGTQRTPGREHCTVITSRSSVLPGVSMPPRLIGISFSRLISYAAEVHEKAAVSFCKATSPNKMGASPEESRRISAFVLPQALITVRLSPYFDIDAVACVVYPRARVVRLRPGIADRVLLPSAGRGWGHRRRGNLSWR
jgi:hypothetical protein